MNNADKIVHSNKESPIKNTPTPASLISENAKKIEDDVILDDENDNISSSNGSC